MSDMLILTGIGRLGRDAEMKTTQSGTQFLVFPLAASTGYGDRKKTTWLDAALFGRQAESLYDYLTKGKAIAFSGEFYVDEWEGDNGKQRTPKITLNHVALLPDGSRSNAAPQDDYSREPRRDGGGRSMGDQGEGRQRSDRDRDGTPRVQDRSGSMFQPPANTRQGGGSQSGGKQNVDEYGDRIPF